MNKNFLQDDCPDVAVLVAFLDGRGDDGLDAHIAECSRCVDKLEILREVEFHNAETPQNRYRDFLNEPEFQDFQQRITNFVKTMPQPTRPSMPDRIQRFEIRKWLGQGTFGDVYAAFDPLLNIDVAIKVSRSGLFSSEASQKDFLQEARHAARLDHPGLVRIRDFIDGDRAIVMNLIDGGTLKDRLEPKPEQIPLTVANAVRMMIQIAQAADVAHEAGLVHRDLKPSNILLDRHDRPVIADFGLVVDQNRQNSTELGRAGTLVYMSPEQCADPPVPIDRRSDLWALGVILAEMIHGKRPFPQTNRAELERAIQQDRPQLPDNKPLRALNGIIKRCLAKNPADRYATASDLAKDLDLWHRQQTATGLSRWGYGWRRNVVLSVSALLLFVATFLVQRQSNANRLVQSTGQLESANPSQIPRLLSEVVSLGATPDFLKDRSVSSDVAGCFRLNLARLACGDNDPQVSTEIVHYLRTAPLDELKAVLSMPDGKFPGAGLLDTTRPLFDETLEPEELLRLGAIVARYGTTDSVWSNIREQVAYELCKVPEQELQDWLEFYDPVGASILGEALRRQMTAEEQEVQTRSAVFLGSFFRQDLSKLVELIRQADGKKMSPLIDALRRLDSRETQAILLNTFQTLTHDRNPTPDDDDPPTDQEVQASRVAVAAWLLGDTTAACTALQDHPNPTLQRLVIFGLKEQSVSTRSITDQIKKLQPVGSKTANAVIFSLLQTLWLMESHAIDPQLLQQLSTSDDSGIHSMSDLLLRQMKLGPADVKPGDHGEWMVDRLEDFTMEFRIVDPHVFTAGTPKFETVPLGLDSWPRHPRRIARRFAIGVAEVTWGQLRHVKPKAGFNDGVEFILSTDSAATHLDEDYLQEIYEFCNWCSKQTGLNPCYELQNGQYQPLSDFLDRSGYRLPTDGEWECACRAGTTTSRYFGQLPVDNAAAASVCNKYGWFVDNSTKLRVALVSQPVRTRLPNRWGLFDTYGNLYELCTTESAPETNSDALVNDDFKASESPSGTCKRGPSVNQSGTDYAQSHARSWKMAKQPTLTGIRLAKSLLMP